MDELHQNLKFWRDDTDEYKNCNAKEPPKKKRGRGYTKPALCKKARKKRQRRSK